MRDLMARMMRCIPSDVELAENGSKGILRFLERPADLVITDLVMPAVDGYTVITVLRNIRPDTRIIAATAGNGHSSLTRDGEQLVLPDRILFKPFFLRELMNAVVDLFPEFRDRISF